MWAGKNETLAGCLGRPAERKLGLVEPQQVERTPRGWLASGWGVFIVSASRDGAIQLYERSTVDLDGLSASELEGLRFAALPHWTARFL